MPIQVLIKMVEEFIGRRQLTTHGVIILFQFAERHVVVGDESLLIILIFWQK